MTWFKLDDGFHCHPKVLRAGNEAIGFYARCGTYCAQHLTDGFVPEAVALLYGDDRLVSILVELGMWKPVDGGFAMHDYLEYNRSREEVLAERAGNARKAALHRDPELLGAVRERDKDRCRYCGTRVQWKDRRGRGGGTYDHVDPQGSNDLGNLVVSCRGCNSKKGARTPDEAGMRLLPAGTLPHGPGPSGGTPSHPQNGSSSVLDTNQNGTGTYQERSKTNQDPDPTRPDPTRISTSSGDETQDPERSVGARKRSPRATRIPDDFTVDTAMVAWARENTPHVDGRLETERFRDYWRAKSGRDATKVDWTATWRNWMRKAQDQTPPHRASPHLRLASGAERTPTTTARVAAIEALRHNGGEP